MARILIVYGTTEGQTRKIAQRIAAVAQARGHEARTVDSATLSGPLSGGEHDAILVGASLHRGRYQSALEGFVRTNLALLNSLPSAFFGVSLVAASRDPEHRKEADRLIERFLAETGWRPARTASLAGALPYSRYGVLKRLLMRLIVWREGGDTDSSRDYDYTDWGAVDGFARSFLGEVAEPAVAQPSREPLA
jgi:menaquinone-dependent protoporphyrinogen oxidase